MKRCKILQFKLCKITVYIFLEVDTMCIEFLNTTENVHSANFLNFNKYVPKNSVFY